MQILLLQPENHCKRRSGLLPQKGLLITSLPPKGLFITSLNLFIISLCKAVSAIVRLAQAAQLKLGCHVVKLILLSDKCWLGSARASRRACDGLRRPSRTWLVNLVDSYLSCIQVSTGALDRLVPRIRITYYTEPQILGPVIEREHRTKLPFADTAYNYLI